MLQPSYIREHKDRVRDGLRKRNWKEEDLAIIDQILALDDRRRKLLQEVEQAQARLKKQADAIGQLYKQGKQQEAETAKAEVASLKEQKKATEEQLKNVQAELEKALLDVPNVPHELVPFGKSEEDNEIYKPWEGTLPELGDDALPHWELAKKYQLFDLELGVKLTGAGFPVYIGQGARLERGLINYFLDRAHAAGYVEIAPPLLVNADTARATGQLPDKEGQMYYVEKDELYLIPTAEVPVTNLYRDKILEPEDFPVKLTGYTPCFRREAGSYGAHVRGLNRVHQFDKVEIVRLEHPDHSYRALDEMLEHVSSLLDELELPYRIVRLCGGDLGFTSALTYDFEVYSAAQKRWLEVSSVSNFETYQSNRLQLRFKDGKKKRLAHTLNGSALALARVVAALLENNQSPEGIRLPKVLHAYVGTDVLS